MSFAKFCFISVIMVTVFAVGGCGDDDDDGGGICSDYCAEIDAIDCLAGGMSVSDCEVSCEAFLDDEDCGTEYETNVQCEIDNGIECVDDFVESEACADEEDAYFDCVFGE